MYTFADSTGNSRRQLQFEGELCEPNVLDVAEENELTTFVQLVEQAGLSDIFLCAGPFTGWIPTNAAFNALDPVVLEFLLDPANNELLQEVLLYHLLPGFYLTTELEPSSLPTIQGETVIVTVNPVTINGATVTEADILACNGVIDKVDEVLLPPSFPMIGKKRKSV